MSPGGINAAANSTHATATTRFGSRRFTCGFGFGNGRGRHRYARSNRPAATLAGDCAGRSRDSGGGDRLRSARRMNRRSSGGTGNPSGSVTGISPIKRCDKPGSRRSNPTRARANRYALFSTESSHPDAHMAAFPDVPTIKYEGPDSTNPLAFRHYNPDEVVEGKSMTDHLRFAVVLLAHVPRHRQRPVRPRLRRPPVGGRHRLASRWRVKRVDVAFEFMEKLGVPFYCFHDRDVAPEGTNLARDEQEPRRGRRRRSRRSSSAPASSCCGAPRTCSATRGSSTGPAPAATPTCSPTPPRR